MVMELDNGRGRFGLFLLKLGLITFALALFQHFFSGRQHFVWVFDATDALWFTIATFLLLVGMFIAFWRN
jgi:hypothetical protein